MHIITGKDKLNIKLNKYGQLMYGKKVSIYLLCLILMSMSSYKPNMNCYCYYRSFSGPQKVSKLLLLLPVLFRTTKSNLNYYCYYRSFSGPQKVSKLLLLLPVLFRRRANFN